MGATHTLDDQSLPRFSLDSQTRQAYRSSRVSPGASASWWDARPPAPFQRRSRCIASPAIVPAGLGVPVGTLTASGPSGHRTRYDLTVLCLHAASPLGGVDGFFGSEDRRCSSPVPRSDRIPAFPRLGWRRPRLFQWAFRRLLGGQPPKRDHMPAWPAGQPRADPARSERSRGFQADPPQAPGCNHCEEEHSIPLSKGRRNDPSNMQGLPRAQHRDTLRQDLGR